MADSEYIEMTWWRWVGLFAGAVGMVAFGWLMIVLMHASFGGV